MVRFLFTDDKGSTRRWENDANAMRAALAAHDDVLRAAIEAHRGFMFKHTGDGMCGILVAQVGGGCRSRCAAGCSSNRTVTEEVGCRQFVATALTAFAAIRRRAGLSGFPTGFFGSSSISVMTSGTLTLARLRRQ